MNSNADFLPVEEDVVLADTAQMAEDRVVVEAPASEPVEPPPPTKPTIIVKVLRGSMEASLLLHRSSPDTLDPLREDLNAALAEQNIVYGINEPLLDELCMKPVYYHVFPIARGVSAAVGKDGYVNYLVDPTFVRRPPIREDGIADYRNLGYPTVVYKDQPLCEIYAAKKGEDGTDIHGALLEGKYGRSPIDPAGLNTAFNPEKTVLHSCIDGRIDIQDGVVSVVEVLKVDGNVDNATGNIRFTGDVVVTGDVASSFVIKCGGSIVINGSVEGATLEAGTDISVSAGMFGMDIGAVHAGGNIKCRFIQNCTIKATGNVYADAIMFSDVECGGSVELVGKKGALIGGRTVVAGKVVAKTIGTSMHVPTEIVFSSAGTDKDEAIARLEKQIDSFGNEIQSIVQMQARYEDINRKSRLSQEQIRELLAAKERYGRLVNDREDARSQMEQIQKEQQEKGRGVSFVECKDKIHTNTRINFGVAKLVVEQSVANSRIQVVDDSISIMPQ